MGLDDITYQSGKMEYRSRRACEPEFALKGYLEEARRILAEAEQAEHHEPIRPLATSAEFEHLRWFPVPEEIAGELEGVEKPPPASDLLQV